MIKYTPIFAVLLTVTWAYAPLREPGVYNDAVFIQELMERINRDMEPVEPAYVDFGSSKMDHSLSGGFVPGRATKDSEFPNSEFFDENDYDNILGSSGHPSIRDQEYLQHSTLYGHKFPGAGSGALNVKGQKVPTEAKPDAVLPAYCNPPNPCPVGYSAEDGCLEIFENSASFSRAYQGSQDCMCDTEHMFDCHASQESDDESDQFLTDLQVDGQHKSLVAKKFYNKQAPEEILSRLNVQARNAAAIAHANGNKLDENPYLQGEKLPIAAKKGNHAL